MKINKPNTKSDYLKFSFKKFGSGKNKQVESKNEENLAPCKVFLGRKGKAILIPKEKKIRIKPD